MTKKIILFGLWFVVWCGLNWPVSAQDAALGVFASLFVTYMTADLAGGPGKEKVVRKRGISGNIIRIAWFLCYIAVFLWECLKANIDVALRVLHPGLPIRPGTVRVRVNLKSDAGLTLLANSITLTPGTTSVDIDREKGILYVHWIYVKGDHAGGWARLPVAEKFERILKRIFE